MKKLLIATAALALTAGAAAAQGVQVGGDARFGLDYDSSRGVDKARAQHRVRLVFRATVETDAGLTFGVWTRANIQHTNSPTSNVFNGSRIFMRSGGLTVTAGNDDGAITQRVAIYGGGIGFTNGIARVATHRSYTEVDNQPNQVRADYTVGGFTGSISTEYRNANALPAGATGGFTNDSTEVAVSYAANGMSFGAGYRQGGNYSISAGYAQGDFAVGALVSRVTAASAAATNAANAAGIAANGGFGVTFADTNYRLWGTYAMGATTLRATFTQANGGNNFGVGASYNLGGGASVHGGVARHSVFNAAGVERKDTVGQVGVTFSF